MNLRIFALGTQELREETARLLCPAADAYHADCFRAYGARQTAQVSLAANVLLRYAAAQMLSVPMRCVTTDRLPSGQPTLPGTGLFCSVSHTDGMCVCAAADAPVGIDVEKLRDPPMRVAERVFSPGELRVLGASDDPRLDFFRFWTRRESVVKLTGAGLRDIRAAVPDGIETDSFLLRDVFCVSVSTFTESS